MKPLCDLLTVPDSKILLVALEGIENVLKTGALQAEENQGGNVIARYVEEAGGLDKIEALQTHQEKMIYSKASRILSTYYDTEAEEVDIVPSENPNANQFGFGMNNTGNNQGPDDQTGFNFGGGVN